MVERMKRGEKKSFVVGVGHGGCTCEGAAFEYVVNLEFQLRAHKVRDKADIVFLTNEYELGDFGVNGVHIRRGGYITPSKIFAESLFAERGIRWITKAHVREIESNLAHVETLDEGLSDLHFDMAMLLPPFTGVGLKAFNRKGEDITGNVFAPNGFMKVDADYQKKAYGDWKAKDWPRHYQSPVYPNLFAAGIAFAPPHPISEPHTTTEGIMISPAPPRTGMPSAIIGKTVARSIVDMLHGSNIPTHTASLAEMGAACVASAGANPFTGTAASITVFPIVPDFERYPGIRARYRPHIRRDRSGWALDQNPSASHVLVQSPASTRLVSHPGIRIMTPPSPPSDWFYATKPTRTTLFLRTFVPYQLWRFLWISLKMVAIIRLSHSG